METRRRGAGRPPTGVRPGEKVSDYQRMTIRMPTDVRLQLSAAAGALNLPEWRVLVDAVNAYVGNGPALSDEQKRVIRAVQKIHAR